MTSQPIGIGQLITDGPHQLLLASDSKEQKRLWLCADFDEDGTIEPYIVVTIGSEGNWQHFDNLTDALDVYNGKVPLQEAA